LGLVIPSAIGWNAVASIAPAFELAVAFVAAFPVNRYLIARGRGHAVVHEYHGGDHDH